MNNNYGSRFVKQTGNKIQRVINDKLIISIAKNSPKYIESSIDRPNFYDPIKYQEELLLDPTLTKTKFVDKQILNYEVDVLNMTLMNNAILIQAYQIGNDVLTLTAKPYEIAKQLDIPLKDVFNLTYLKVVNITTTEVKYYWIGNIINNEDRKSSITIMCIMDYWTSYFNSVVMKMSGDVDILQKHFNRFTPETMLPDFSYDNPVHNITPAFGSMGKNIIELSGYNRNQLINGTTFTTNVEIANGNNSSKRVIKFSNFTKGQSEDLNWINEGEKTFQDLNNKVIDGLTLDGWNNIYASSDKVYAPPLYTSADLTSGNFLYTFRFNANDDAGAENLDATMGVESFITAQSNEQYEPILPISETGQTYAKTLMNRIANVINTKIVNNQDNSGDITTYNGEYIIKNSFPLPEEENLIYKFSFADSNKKKEVRIWKPYKILDPLYFQEGVNTSFPTPITIWNLGGVVIGFELSESIYNKTEQMIFIDFNNKVESIDFDVKATGFQQFKPKWTIKNKPGSVTKSAYTLNELNKDNYNALTKNYKLQLNNEYAWLDQTFKYTPNSDWDYTYEPQLYMSHCFDRRFDYLGASKSIPYEIFQNTYDIHLQQTLTPSLAIDNIYITSDNQKARLMLSNGGIRTTYNNSIASITDIFNSYMQQNSAQLNNSYLTAQGQLQFAKQKQVAGITMGVVGLVGSVAALGVTSFKINPGFIKPTKHNKLVSDMNDMAYKINLHSRKEAITYASYNRTPASISMIGDGLGTIASLGGIAGSIKGIVNSVIGGNQNIFRAEQSIKRIESGVKDLYNGVDELIYNSTSIYEINNYYTNINELFNNDVSVNGLIRALEIKQLPLTSKLKEYSMYVNQTGYIANRMFFKQDIDTLLNRSRFNFIQLGEVQNMFSNINVNIEVKNHFMSMFNNGVRLWNIDVPMLDYSKENWEIDIVLNNVIIKEKEGKNENK